MRKLLSGLCTASLLIIFLSNVILNASLGSFIPEQNRDFSAGGIASMPSVSVIISSMSRGPYATSAQIQTPPDPTSPPTLAHASCPSTLSGGGVTNTISIPTEYNNLIVTANNLLVKSNLTLSGTTHLTAHRIIVNGSGILEVVKGATIIISQDSAKTGGIAVTGSGNLTMNNGFFTTNTIYDTCILMNSTSPAHITNSVLYQSSPNLSVVLSGSAEATIDRGSSLGILELRGYSAVSVDSDKLSANVINGGLIMRDHAEAEVHGSSVSPTLVFNGPGTSSIDQLLALHPFTNGTIEDRLLGPSNLQVSWSLNITSSVVPNWNLVSEESAVLILSNTASSLNATGLSNIESFNHASTTLLAFSNVTNVYAFGNSIVQVNEDPGDMVSTASLGNLQLTDSANLTLNYINEFSIGSVVATAGSQVYYLNSPANGTYFQIGGNAKFVLRNSTTLWSNLAFSGYATFLAENSRVFEAIHNSQPAAITMGNSLTAVFTNTNLTSIITTGSATVNVKNPALPLEEVSSEGSSTLIITDTNILKASQSIDSSHLTITNSTPPDIDAFNTATLTINQAAASIVTDNDGATVNIQNSNVTTLLVCVFRCPLAGSSAFPTATVSSSLLSTAIISSQGNLNLSNSNTTAILAGTFGGTLALTNSNVNGRLSFNGGPSVSTVEGTLALNGKVTIQALTISYVPRFLIEGVFTWNINRSNAATIVTVSGSSSTVYRMFKLRFLDATAHTPLQNIKPYIPSLCNHPNTDPNIGCPYMDALSGSDSGGYVNFTVPFISSDIASTLTLAAQRNPGESFSIKEIGTSTGLNPTNTLAFADDAAIPMSVFATEVFGTVPALQPFPALILIAAIIPMTVKLLPRRKGLGNK